MYGSKKYNKVTSLSFSVKAHSNNASFYTVR